MSYAEERVYIAKVRLEYAERGFQESAKKAAADIASAKTPEDVESIAKSLLLDKQVLEDAKKNYDFVKNHYFDEVTV
jgi:hypothetical protein